MKVKDHIKGRTVRFEFFREGALWYKVRGTGLLFPVPTDAKEVGSATFNRDDKAMLFMRYIRKYLKEIEDAKAEEVKLPDGPRAIEDGMFYCSYEDDHRYDECILKSSSPADCVHANDHNIEKKEDCEFWKKITIVKP